ncbi:SpvB/TcaC N-terminal domain-containing protein [Chryseobacterium sp. Hurlbut01]|jgi:YD repeat-containing protein|uniref:SpvB/TcaC N-terminal domain-containing protein n=1 Tax=Chryseobacterium sp. Hurlbut01 TaxID=1681828 RepID=UPI0009E4563E|nr:SpvB/TcaC N-terminal domain-containing protein [Chryseobacterium sp. Hurlbut01]
MKIKSFKVSFTKKPALLVSFFAIMLLFASFTKEDRYKVRVFKLKMIEKYMNHHVLEDKPETDRVKTINENTDNSSSSSILSLSENTNVNDSKQFSVIPNIVGNKNIDQIFESEEKQGMIGEFSDDESDNPSDNFFTINIPDVKNQNVKAYLVYNLFGLESYHSVSRSINKNLAFGGNIILPSNSWSSQKEEISLGSLKEGKNSILFTSSINGIKYKVKNVKIVFEKGLNSAGSISSLRSGNQLYIKGIQNALVSNPLMINNKSLQSTNGEFESLIELTEENKAKGNITIKDANSVQEYTIPVSKSSFKTLNENSYASLVINISKDNEYNETYENATVTVEKNSVESSAQVQVLKLRKKDYPAVSREIKNMTANLSAYRLSLKAGVLTKKVKLSIPYDDKKLGARSSKEVKAFYFDYSSKKWKVDPTSKVDAVKKVVTVEGNGDTDYINGVISVPESSQLESFAPTSISGLKAADPTAGLQLMAIPSANQKGDANAEYPIRVPSGLGGLQPSLSIGYSSGGGNGWMGDGWNINGLSSITVDTRWGVPEFDAEGETELYSLDGEMLVYPNQYLPHRHNDVSENNTAITTAKQQRTSYIDPTNSQVKKFYLRKNHDFSLIERIGNSPGNYTWKVTFTDGTKRYYGGSPDSTLSGIGGISHWGLRMIEDVHGNTMEFTYFNEGGGGGQFYQIKKIAYGKNKDYTVNFIKETSITRKDISINAKQGFARSEPYLLKEVQVKYKTELVRTYKMDYIDGEFFKTLLKRIYIVPHNPCSTTLVSKSEIRDIDDGSGGGGGTTGGIEPTCTEITDSYTFDYYNDVKDGQGNVKIYGPDTSINLQNDKYAYSGFIRGLINPSKINGNISSEKGFNFRVAAGLNFYYPSNDAYGHLMFGFPFGYSNAEARNAQQLIDFNGDGIQDMIYRVPDEGLFLRTGHLDTLGNLSFNSSQPIGNYSGDFSFTETKTTNSGWDMGAIVYSKSQISSSSTSTTKTYLIDANSDGLTDVVHNGEVWFNRFNRTTGKSEMTKHSEHTENMIVKAKAVQTPIPCTEKGCPQDPVLPPTPITDVVKVWVAPKDGYVKFTDDIQLSSYGILQNPPQKMYYSVEILDPTPVLVGSVNVYNNGRIYLTEVQAGAASQSVFIERYNDYFPYLQSSFPQNGVNSHWGINNSNRLFVKSGDKIYVRLHKNTTQNYIVSSNPKITYVDSLGSEISNNFAVSQDQFQINNGSYSNNMFLNDISAPIYLDGQGTANIVVENFSFPYLTDKVTFRIVTVNAAGTITDLISPETYDSQNLNTVYHSFPLTVNASEPVHLRFIVESDSHTNFYSANWNGKINVFYNASTPNNPNASVSHLAIPEYPSFVVDQLTNKLQVNQLPNPGISGSHNFGIQINKNIGNFSNLGTGSFYYVIKKGNTVLAKRTIIVSHTNNIVIEKDMITGQTINGLSPIDFYIGDPTASYVDSSQLVTVQVYCKTGGDFALFKAYSNYFQGKPFNVYYDSSNNYASTSATAVNTAMYNTKSAFYNNWGQFLYSPGSYTDYIFGAPIQLSAFDTNVTTQNTYPLCQGITNEADLAACILNTTSNPNAGNNTVANTVSLLKPRMLITRGGFRRYWVGIGPNQYTTELGFHNDETVNYFSNPVPVLPSITPVTYTSGQLSVDTTMKGINKVNKSGSYNNTNGLSFGMGSGGNSITQLSGIGSVETQTFSDLNGDGYPDIVYPSSVQFTNSTGSLNNVQVLNSGDFPTSSNSYQKMNSLGFSYNAFSVTGRIGAQGGNGTTTRADTGLPWSGGASISAGVNDYYDSYDSGKTFWMDINGDGLPDRIKDGGTTYMTYAMNMGRSLGGYSSYQNLITYRSRPKGSFSLGIGGSLGALANLGALSSFGFGISASVGASASTGTAETVYEDVNGDGLIDILEINNNNNSTTVRYNLGNKFDNATPLLKSSGVIDFTDETRSFNGSFSFGANYMFNIGPITLVPPVVLLILWIKAGGGATANLGLNVSETRKAFKDMNGDGFTDLVVDNNNGFTVNYSQIGRTNKLKSITNTISKGRYNLDYQFARSNYDNPHAKLVVNKITVTEPDVFSSNYTTDQGNKMETKYTFLNRKYDRRERDDFGFDTVIKQEMNGASIERVSTDYYYNNTYLMNGMIKKSTVQNGSGSYLSEVRYEYKLRKYINNTSQIDLNSDLGTDYDMGGSEGRKMATAMLVQKQNKVFESGGDITTIEQFKYTTLGLMEQYQYISPSASYNSNITYQSYGNNIIGIPALIEVYDGNTQSTLLRQRRAENINYYTGDVGSYITFDGTQDIVTDVEYYATGNVKKIAYPLNNNGQRYVIDYTYDDLETGKFVTKVKDNFNIESKATYNPLFDVVIRKVDTGGNAMVFYYDGFGRTKSIMGPNEIAANSTVPTVKYDYWTDHAGIPNNDATVKIYKASTANYDPEHASSNNTINTDTYADFLGRIIQVKKDIQTANGESRSVSGRILYDGLGRAIRQHHPTVAALGNQNLIPSGSGPSTTSSYDSRDRVISATDEDGNTKHIAYAIENNLLKVTEEFSTQKSESFSNVEGKVVQKNDYLNSQPLTTIFNYSTIGELMNVTDPEGMSTQYSYNLAGRRTQQIHPDKGTTSYEYDPAGNMVKLTTDNLLNDSGINTHFIEYKYDFNRLSEIVLPNLPSGNPNPNNVIYQYGPSTAGNNAGKLVAKSDGTGDTGYKYGRMGEMISELRIIRGAHIPEMYFKTYFNYDSWNRVTKIKYPDDEIVSYHYDLGGNLKSVDNNYGETYIQDIRYDHYEQREVINYGNGTSQHYSYNQQNRKLDKYFLYDSVYNMMLNNTYQYDEFSNITKIKNEAYPLANGMGGAFQSYFGYDTLNRLTGTGSNQTILDGEQQPIQNTFIAPTTYQLEMEYNNVGGIVQKIQHHERDQNVVYENTYKNKYEYVQNTHKLERVYDALTGNSETFDYDFNGNAVNHNDQNGTKKMYWDEQDRLKAFYNDNNGIYQYYTYDDKGERTIKYGLDIPTHLYQNGVPIDINELKLFEFKIYPNPYLTVSSTGQYTKHYFEGSKRFASRLMDDAVRYEDPSVLYTNRTAEDKPTTKPADVEADFKQYLEKTDLGQNVSVELREAYQSPDLYYLHGDHLGTATFVTNSQSQATQFFLNLPFGETMMEQMDGSYNNPFKFNAKELDDDTGLYYYNPRLSIWYGVEPTSGKICDSLSIYL